MALLRGKSAEETAIDLVIEDGSRVFTVYFIMSEENIHKKMRVRTCQSDGINYLYAFLRR